MDNVESDQSSIIEAAKPFASKFQIQNNGESTHLSLIEVNLATIHTGTGRGKETPKKHLNVAKSQNNFHSQAN